MDNAWIGKGYSLQPHKKFQRGTVWVSGDEARLPLRVEVKVFIGHVFAEWEEVGINLQYSLMGRAENKKSRESGIIFLVGGGPAGSRFLNEGIRAFLDQGQL